MAKDKCENIFIAEPAIDNGFLLALIIYNNIFQTPCSQISGGVFKFIVDILRPNDTYKGKLLFCKLLNGNCRINIIFLNCLIIIF